MARLYGFLYVNVETWRTASLRISVRNANTNYHIINCKHELPYNYPLIIYISVIYDKFTAIICKKIILVRNVETWCTASLQSSAPTFAATVHIVLITLYFRIGTNHFFCVYLKIQNNDILITSNTKSPI